MVREEFFEKVNLVELLEKVRNRFGKFKEEQKLSFIYEVLKGEGQGGGSSERVYKSRFYFFYLSCVDGFVVFV